MPSLRKESIVVGSGHVSGHVEIKQALPPPDGEINNVHGHLHELGLPPGLKYDLPRIIYDR